MSEDYETLEINQPKIRYFQKRSENNTEWLDELINKLFREKLNINGIALPGMPLGSAGKENAFSRLTLS